MIDYTYPRRIRLYWLMVGHAIELANAHMAFVQRLECATLYIDIRRTYRVQIES